MEDDAPDNAIRAGGSTRGTGSTGTIIALGGGGFSMSDDPRMDRYLLRTTGVDAPTVLFIPTASGDADGYIMRFLEAFTRPPLDASTPRVLRLFRRDVDDLRAQVMAADLVYVGGGNTANMLAVWRLHGVDAILREAWDAGVVLAGLSAGSLCWFEAGVTDSFGPDLAPMWDGLGFLPGSHCPHFDGEAMRRPRYTELVADGALASGLAIDDDCAVRFAGTKRVEVVAARPKAAAYEVGLDGDGDIETRPLAAQLLDAEGRVVSGSEGARE